MSGKDKPTEIESRALFAEGWRGEWGLIASSYEEFFGVIEVFQNLIVVMFAQIYKFKTHLKWMN